MRRSPSLLIGLALALGLIGGAAPALAAPYAVAPATAPVLATALRVATEEESPVPDTVSAWFTDKAQATVRSYGADAFADFSAEDVSAFTVGSPQPTAELGRGTAPDTAIRPATRWIAPIMGADAAVGAVSVSFASGVADDEIVRGDVRLGAALTRDDDVLFVWDPQLSAWFLRQGDAIEPADSAGAKIVLGSVPLADFLLQRERIITDADAAAPPAEDPEEADVTAQPRNVPLTVAVLLVALALLIGSLVWLRSEQSSGREDETEDGAREEVAATSEPDEVPPRKGVVGKRAAKMKFRDSGTKVSVYRTKKAKDDSGLFDD